MNDWECWWGGMTAGVDDEKMHAVVDRGLGLAVGFWGYIYGCWFGSLIPNKKETCLLFF